MHFGLHELAAKVPGVIYCFNKICHRVLTLLETKTAIGQVEAVVASFYGDSDSDHSNPRRETSSGEIYEPGSDDNLASPIYPNGTTLLVRSPSTGIAAIVRVNNSGPYSGERRLDVSEKLAEHLGFLAEGLAVLEVVVLSEPSASEARFKARRHYPRVPGAIGYFRDLNAAMLAGSCAMEKLNYTSTGSNP